MNGKILIGLSFFMVIIFFACKKNKEPLTPTNGIYRGVFNRVTESGDTTGTGITYLALYESTNSFSLRGDTSSNAPFSCSGTYKLLENQKIDFTNNAFIVGGLWDKYYILDTVFTYEFLDTALFINLNFESVRYNYNLTRY